MPKRLYIIFPLLFLSFSGFASTLSLPSIFSDHMVLQCGQPVPVWGKADPGAAVTVEFAGQKKTVTAGADGKWRTDLDPMPASSTSRPFQVSSFEFQVSFSDVLVGEVWLCSGQSNMDMALQGSVKYPVENSIAEVAAADFPSIRLYQTPKMFSAVPVEPIDSCWNVCTPESAKTFSAVAYYFGRKLHHDLNIPVGLIQSAWGGTSIDPWTAPCGYEGIDALTNLYRIAKNIPPFSKEGNSKKQRQTPASLFNGMIYAHVPFAIRGVLWYQGEHDHTQYSAYLDKTRALLNGWRKLWGYEFPFYFVQIAPHVYGEEDPFILPKFWEVQAEIVKTIPNTGMAVITDAGTPENIHPPYKKIPGIRLALLAEANTYGINMVSTGPVFQTLEKSEDHLKVVFSAADGLATRDGKAPDWFEIAGTNGVFKKADAGIKGSSVILSSPEVPDPVAVRFGWNKVARPNLMNSAGLPAAAFRAGKRFE